MPISGPTERELLGLVLRTNTELVVSVLTGAGDAHRDSVMAAVSATRSLALIVDDTLHALVQQARVEGHTWAEIGELLHVTRQAAFHRFGTAGAPEMIDATDIPPLADAERRALQLARDFLADRIDEVRGEFSERMRERESPALLRSTRAQITRNYGAVLEIGKPSVTSRPGFTVVDVPLACEAGDLRGQITFDIAGQVAGLFFLPVS